MNDLPQGLASHVKLFADDKSLFFVLNNNSVSACSESWSSKSIRPGTRVGNVVQIGHC